MIRALDRLAWGLNLLGTLLVAALAALICADVIGRAALDLPIRGVAELASLAIVTLVFLQLPHAVAKGRMIRSEMLLGALMARSPRAGGLAEAAFRLVGAAFFGAVAWAVWPELLTAWERGTYVGASGDFTAPIWPKLAVVTLGAALASALFAIGAARALADPASVRIEEG